MLNEMVLCEELFYTPSGVAFADFITEGHRETWPIRSKRFRIWLRRCYYRATGSAPSAAAIRAALDLLEARAQFDGPERAVNTRVAEDAGRLYLDLADEHFLNLSNQNDFVLVVAWLLAALRSSGPYPLRNIRRAGLDEDSSIKSRAPRIAALASSNSRQSSVSERRRCSPIGPKVSKIARSAKWERPMISSIPFKRAGRAALNSSSV